MGKLISQNTPIEIPPFAESALRTLESGGHEAWFVGGCVRDAMLGRTTHDYDIATDASWEQVEQTLKARGIDVRRTGTKHGTVTAIVDGNGIEITTYRTDGAYADGRHPVDVSFVNNIEEDLARRDFTINAMAYHPDRGVLDCYGGMDDLRDGILRTVGDPATRFKEDGLRILRGCRFASQLGFAIDDETLQHMKSRKMMLMHVSAERITHELDGMLLGDHVHDALMETVDVLGAVMPEIAACKGFDQHTPYHIYDVWEHTAWVVQYSPATRLARWAALFHDIGKPGACFFEGQRAHFYGHAKLSKIMARDIMERLALSPSFASRVLKLVEIHDDQIAATHSSVKRCLSRLGGDVELAEALIGIKKADALAQSDLSGPRIELADDLRRVLDEVIANEEAFTVRQLSVNGNDIMKLGIPAGPEIGDLLDEALNAVIEGTVENDREPLLELIANAHARRLKVESAARI